MQGEFSPVRYEDIYNLLGFLNCSGEFSCEDSLVNMLIWRDIYNYEYLETENCLIIRLFDNSHMLFHLPFGEDFEGGVKLIIETAKEAGQIPMIVLSDGIRGEKFKKLFGDKFNFTPHRDGFDYIYSIEKLQTLSGKKFHSKRNHISSFSKKYNWSFEEITNDNIPDILKVADRWFSEKGFSDDDEEIQELKALPFILSDRQELNLKGGILYVDEEPIGYTLGSALNSEVFVTHSEKVLSDYNGGYSVINREFAKTLSEYKYVNREDDLGIEGLRHSKLSYYPDILLEKYICTPI